jgi:hypothetical protein
MNTLHIKRKRDAVTSKRKRDIYIKITARCIGDNWTIREKLMFHSVNLNGIENDYLNAYDNALNCVYKGLMTMSKINILARRKYSDDLNALYEKSKCGIVTLAQYDNVVSNLQNQINYMDRTINDTLLMARY